MRFRQAFLTSMACFLLVLVINACASNSTQGRFAVTQPWRGLDLPLPSQLRTTSGNADLVLPGSGFDPVLPHNNAAADAEQCVLSPDWQPGGAATGLAYTTYQFETSGLTLTPSLQLTFTQEQAAGDCWIALAQFGHDRWQWFELPAEDELPFSFSEHVSATGQVFVVVLALGDQPWRLSELRIAADIPVQEAWTMFGHDAQHTLRSAAIGPQDDNLRWSYTTDSASGGWASPAVTATGDIYIPDFLDTLVKLSSSGAKQWSFSTAGQAINSPAIGADNVLYITSADCRLYALNTDGTERWQFLAGNMIASPPVLAVDGTIYFGSADEYLYAVNPDGTEKWRFDANGYVFASPALGADGTVYAASCDCKLYAVSPTGEKLWDFTTGDEIHSSPAVGSDGAIYFGSDDYKIYALEPNGTLRWNFATGNNVWSTPALDSNGYVYFCSQDHYLYALDQDGSLLWRVDIGYGPRTSPVIDGAGRLYICGFTDYFAFNPDGSLLWSRELPSGLYLSTSTSAIGPDGTVYVQTIDGILYAFGPSI